MKLSIASKVHIASLLIFWIFSSIFQQFFIFNKTIYIPSWASSWPFPMFIGVQAAFISIAAIAVAEKNEDELYKRVLFSPFLMPISAITAFSVKYINEVNSVGHLISAMVSNYLYIALVICLIPAIFVLLLYEAIAYARRALKRVSL